jgi:hypothetical protein
MAELQIEDIKIGDGTEAHFSGKKVTVRTTGNAHERQQVRQLKRSRQGLLVRARSRSGQGWDQGSRRQ